ncbi:MAG: glycosyltransferase [Ignavibacteria bacterium]|nr:glycosyltransferase [Ignavibacteria bacterium]
MEPKTSLIISVYKKIPELGFILDALKLQSFKEFEIIISDDGSGSKMNEYIKYRRKEFKIPVKHIYHQDEGFRKNKILNKAVLSAETEYLIFIDGDCIPHPEFLKEHYINRNDNTVLCGKRVMMGRNISDDLSPVLIKSRMLFMNNFKFFNDSLFGGFHKTRYAEDSIYIKNKYLRKKILNRAAVLTGCNFSLPKELLLKINGFDENYTGPGIGEDSDIEYRLNLAGAESRSVRHLAIIYHVFHRATLENIENKEYFEKVKQKGEFRCKNGIEKD